MITVIIISRSRKCDKRMKEIMKSSSMELLGQMETGSRIQDFNVGAPVANRQKRRNS